MKFPDWQIKSATNPNMIKNTDIIQNIPVINKRIPARIPSMASDPRFGILAVYNIKTLPANKATIIGINGKVTGVICAIPPITNAMTK